jgi:NAD(P)-dependent dehydrogenase (short-subunit alcohol dehydrogenase family)
MPMSATLVDARAYVPAGKAMDGRVILVTGASDGIGKALALACAGLGARVILCGRKVPKLESTYDAIIAAGGPRPSIAVLDFERADAAAYEALGSAIREEFGRLDGLAQVAAMLGERAPLEHYDAATWLRVMHVNANGPFLLTRTVLPLLRASSDASVVFTTSSVSIQGRAYWGAYSVSKFALEGLMQILAQETDTTTSIRANSVNPGGVRTAMRAQAYPGESLDAVPLPVQVLPTFLYLLGPDSRGVTGRRFECQ